MENKPVPIEDLEHIFKNTIPLWEGLKNKNILITGGTGFFGKWILESFLHVNELKSLNSKAYVVSRNPELFLKNYPWYNNHSINFIKGDIQNFKFPTENIEYIIHAATEANFTLNVKNPVLMFETITNGTKHILELAKVKNVKAILHTSSGAIYGKQPSEMPQISEDFKGCPDIYSDGAAYGEGKRVAEMLCNFYYAKYNVQSKIARCFAFVGPHLPLDGSYAIGNFIQDILLSKNIVIKGDGTPFRSYLYASDLVIWLWSILINGTVNKPYNVGSDQKISIKNLADKIILLSKQKLTVEMNEPILGLASSYYIPSIDRARNELGLEVKISLDEGIKKTVKYYQSIKKRV